jgi:glycosyltransferase involved in cell wall biosynthesis
MSDIIFDFSNSAQGGSQRRLAAYADYFSDSSLDTHFFVSEHSPFCEYVSSRVKTTIVSKSGHHKLALRTRHLSSAVKLSRWLFSYGIPVYHSNAIHNWLHISNVLPFCYHDCTLSQRLKWKTFFQTQQFKITKSNHQIVSGESQFAIDQYQAALKWHGQTVILRNGMAPMKRTNVPKETFAVIVGTDSYKRLDLAYQLFQDVKERFGLTRLVVVGRPNDLLKSLISAPDIECRSSMSHPEMLDLLERASLFISASEAENSSNAVMEAMYLTGKLLISDIPSHREMFAQDVSTIASRGQSYIYFDNPDVDRSSFPIWDTEISKMVRLMGF